MRAASWPTQLLLFAVCAVGCSLAISTADDIPCSGEGQFNPPTCGVNEVCHNQKCVACAAEICGNEFDDDCNGVVDDCKNKDASTDNLVSADVLSDTLKDLFVEVSGQGGNAGNAGEAGDTEASPESSTGGGSSGGTSSGGSAGSTGGSSVGGEAGASAAGGSPNTGGSNTGGGPVCKPLGAECGDYTECCSSWCCLTSKKCRRIPGSFCDQQNQCCLFCNGAGRCDEMM